MMHIFSMKRKTKQMEIRPIADPPVFFVPLSQHIGTPARPIVTVGERVKKYQLIGEAAEGLSANIHSPVSGEVREITECTMADGTSTPCIVIENDFQEEEITPATAVTEPTGAQVVEIVRSSGIVGEGGAAFPTSTKYTIGNQKIDTFIVNGTECEPYLTADYALMTQHTQALLDGILIVNRVLQATDIVITIEKQNAALKSSFTPFLQQEEYKQIRIVVLPNTYPQGGELQLIKAVTGIELPRTQLPRDVGVIVNNVGTIYAVYQAVRNGKPLVSRFITLSGEESTQIGNYEVKIGTPISHLFKELNISPEGKTVVLGGPMMGKRVEAMDAPLTKGSSGVLFLKTNAKKRSHCISCGYCVDVCPMHLMPMKFEENYRKGAFFKLEKYNISNCIECAACEYVCPSNVPLIESIKEGKIKLKELVNAIQ